MNKAEIFQGNKISQCHQEDKIIAVKTGCEVIGFINGNKDLVKYDSLG